MEIKIHLSHSPSPNTSITLIVMWSAVLVEFT